MENIPEKVAERLMVVINDIIYLAHRRRVPSNDCKHLFIEQILKIDELKEYFTDPDSEIPQSTGR
jgi:hypothetical protein